jgi:hypothetical protein
MFKKALHLLLPAGVALAVSVSVVPASAAQPFKEHFVNEGIFTLPDIHCRGFTLHEEMLSEDVTTTTYFDGSGVPKQVATKANFDGVITNSATGATTPDHSVFTETDDLVNGTTTISGPSYHYKVPGQGDVYAEVGHQIFVTDTGEVIFQAGPDDFTQQDLAGLCVALA